MATYGMRADRQPSFLALSSSGVCQAFGTMVLQERPWVYDVRCLRGHLHAIVRTLTSCYAYASHRKKREAKIKREVKRGIREPNEQNPFEIFVTVTDIRYT